MEKIDLTKTVRDKVESCPNCGGKLIQTSVHYVRCKQCSLSIEVMAGREAWINLVISGVVLIGMLAFIIGTVIEKWVLLGHV